MRLRDFKRDGQPKVQRVFENTSRGQVHCYWPSCAVVVYWFAGRVFEALEFKARFQSTLAAEAIANNAVVKSMRRESGGRLSLGAASAASSGSSVTPSALLLEPASILMFGRYDKYQYINYCSMFCYVMYCMVWYGLVRHGMVLAVLLYCHVLRWTTTCRC